MIKINNRLKCVASFINENDHAVLDVGCDHALLDIYLLEQNNNLKIIASDINEGPLKKAQENINKYQVSNQIILKLADGLESIEQDIDTIIISGMGTETIVNILNRKKDELYHVNKLILSSNNKFQELRQQVTTLGFKIHREKIIFEDNKFYIIIEFVKGKKEYTYNELYFGPYLLKHKNDLFNKYYSYIKEKKEKVLYDLPNSLIDKKNKLENEIKLLTKELNS